MLRGKWIFICEVVYVRLSHHNKTRKRYTSLLCQLTNKHEISVHVQLID